MREPERGGADAGVRVGRMADAAALGRFAAGAAAAGRAVVVGALVVDDAGRIYVQRRSLQRALFPGCWDIVGGHVEAGEAPLDALAREVREETGWELAALGPVVEVIDWSGGDGVMRREVDLLARVSGDLSRPRLEPGKHDEGRWLTPSEVHVLLEGRDPTDRWVHDVVERGFALLKGWLT